MAGNDPLQNGAGGQGASGFTKKKVDFHQPKIRRWMNYDQQVEFLRCTWGFDPPFMANILQEYQFLLLLVDLVLTCFPPIWPKKRRLSKSVALRLPAMDGPKKNEAPSIRLTLASWRKPSRNVKNHQESSRYWWCCTYRYLVPNHKPPKYVGTQHEQIPSPVQPNFCRPIATQIVHAWRMKLHFPKEIKKNDMWHVRIHLSSKGVYESLPENALQNDYARWYPRTSLSPWTQQLYNLVN